MEFPRLFCVVLALMYSAKICAHQHGDLNPQDLVVYNALPSVFGNDSGTYVVNKTMRNLHVLSLNASHVNKTMSIRLNTTTNSSLFNTGWDQEACPVMFTLTQSRSTRSWALPLNEKTEKGKHPFKSFKSVFTVCLEQDYISSFGVGRGSGNASNIELLVFVSTCNPTNVDYSIQFTFQSTDFMLDLGIPITNVEVTPTISHFYRFNFPKGTDRVAVVVESKYPRDSVCMTAAVQSPWCRLLNENTLSSVDSKGEVSNFNTFWQDMNTKAVLPVAKTEFSDGFFIGFMVHPDDERCRTYKGVSADSWTPIQAIRDHSQQRHKFINITVQPELSTSEYTMPILYPLDYVLVIVAITAIIYSIFHCIDSRNRPADDTEALLNNDELGNNPVNGNAIGTQKGQPRKSSFRSLFTRPTNQGGGGQRPSGNAISQGNTYAWSAAWDIANHNSDAAGPSNSHNSSNTAAEKPDVEVLAGAGAPTSALDGVESSQQQNIFQQHITSQGFPVANQNAPEDSDSETETFSPPPPPVRDGEDDVLVGQIYQQSVKQLGVRFSNENASRSNSSRTRSDDGTSLQWECQYETSWLRMDAFIRKRKVKKYLDRIYLLIGAIGIFYGLPTVQLLYTYHQISESTGQTDLCYRNYLCSHRVYSWDDFNHIYSNIVYVLLAIVFCIFVRLYDKKIQKLEAMQQLEEGDIGHGVVHQFGIFYALGLAFGLEGILSALYHVCPTRINFQFDTSFMFILAVVSTIKIYQFRHPNPICPHNIFGLLALTSFISVGGIILGSKIYEGVFIFLHIAMIIMLSVYLYYIGFVRDSDNNPVTDSAIFRKSGFLKKLRNSPFVIFKPNHGSRLTFLLPLIVFNLAINISQILGQNPFPTYLVYIFAGNMMLYFVYYCLMKIYHGEAFNVQFIQPFIYLVFSFVLGSLGILYFMDKKYNASLSPAGSRALNADCIIAKFYDSHDLWHFLSAGSIFFFFMTLLTLDDGIKHKSRNEIVAF